MCRVDFHARVVQVFCLVWLGLFTPTPALPSPAPPATAPTEAASSAKSMLLRDNPILQEKVSVEATNCSLGDVLAGLSPRLKVDLTASAQVADQRVTLRLTNQPLYLLMERLPALLSHLPSRPRGYYWEKLDRPITSRPAFNLWRDLRSVQDEEYERDYPRREAAVLVKDLRNLSRLTPQEREKYQGDFPYIRFPGISPTEDGPEGAALKGLTDEQIDALLAGEKIPLNPALFTKQIVAFKQKQRTNQARVYAAALRAGYPVPEPPDVPPMISLLQADREGEYPDQATIYELRLEGLGDYGVGLDVFDTKKNRDPRRIAPPIALATAAQGPMIDLTPLLGGEAVTAEQRKDIGFTLQALAKAAHITLYQEAFVKPSVDWAAHSNGLATLKAPLPDLIVSICQEWNYQAQKVGDDYIFCSRTWAQDRAADVPNRLVTKWQLRLKKQKALTLADRADIAASLTWPQVKLTLAKVLPASGPWDSVATYKTLRLIGLLSPVEQEAAFSTNGLLLADMPPWIQQSFVADFRRNLSKIPSDQVERSVLTFQTEQAGSVDMPTEVISMNLSTDGQSLFGTLLVINLPPPAAISTATPPENKKTSHVQGQ